MAVTSLIFLFIVPSIELMSLNVISEVRRVWHWVAGVDPQVLEAFIALYERDACGLFDDVAAATTANIVRASSVEIPVLLASGEHDPIAPPTAVELQRARYELAATTGAASSSAAPATSSCSNAARRCSGRCLNSWLTARGF